MKVAVVTPYFKEADVLLERCLSSVRRQDHPVTHILIADGHPSDVVQSSGVRHVRLDRSHADAGNTARGLGALMAVAEQFEAIAFLDADNWFDDQHVSTCLQTALATTELPDFVVARRRLCRPDGSPLPAEAEDGPADHVDTSCFFLLRTSFHVAARWAAIPKALAPVGDRVFLKMLIAENLRANRCSSTTVNYLCTYRSPYLAVNEEPPAWAKPDPDPTEFATWWRSLSAHERALANRLVGFPLVKATRSKQE
ncbi:MAG TPA: glycosyltransferase [Polyangiaceae bacterium]|nr:glycosyltransferase [Polyangiaceae bacterium]